MLDTLWWSLSPPAVSDWLWGKTWYLYSGAFQVETGLQLSRSLISDEPWKVLLFNQNLFSCLGKSWGRLQLSRDRECTVSSEGKGWIDGWINEWTDGHQFFTKRCSHNLRQLWWEPDGSWKQKGCRYREVKLWQKQQATVPSCSWNRRRRRGKKRLYFVAVLPATAFIYACTQRLPL